MLRPTLEENGIKLVVVGLEQFGAREFVEGQFFDGGTVKMKSWTPLGQKKVSLLVRCPDFRGRNVHKQGVWDSQMCPVYRGVLNSGCPD